MPRSEEMQPAQVPDQDGLWRVLRQRETCPSHRASESAAWRGNGASAAYPSRTAWAILANIWKSARRVRSRPDIDGGFELTIVRQRTCRIRRPVDSSMRRASAALARSLENTLISDSTGRRRCRQFIQPPNQFVPQRAEHAQRNHRAPDDLGRQLAEFIIRAAQPAELLASSSSVRGCFRAARAVLRYAHSTPMSSRRHRDNKQRLARCRLHIQIDGHPRSGSAAVKRSPQRPSVSGSSVFHTPCPGQSLLEVD